MPIHKDQRVGVFVDIQNMYYSAKQFYNSKVSFGHILSKAVAGRKLIRAIAYVIKADIKEEENFFDALEKLGYEVKSKDLQIFFGGAKKGDWDVGIAMDIMRMASKLDVVVLVSGDGDFKDLIEHVKALGCRAEVIAFGKTASSRIIGQADEFIDLDRDLDRALIKDRIYEQKQEQKSFEKTKENFDNNKQNNDNFNNNFKKNNFKNNFKDEKENKFNKFNKFKDNKFDSKFNKKEFSNKNDFSKRFNENKNENHDEISFLQKINMEQPELKEKKEEKQEQKDKTKEIIKNIENIKNSNKEKQKLEFVEPEKNIKQII
ncbi:MAG: NYN domain-containing protein [Candidatus Woesearchaeota archaeon]